MSLDPTNELKPSKVEAFCPKGSARIPEKKPPLENQLGEETSI